ncbi:hypothetical protein CR513_38961, partial [Mucuna pruriens]
MKSSRPRRVLLSADNVSSLPTPLQLISSQPNQANFTILTLSPVVGCQLRMPTPCPPRKTQAYIHYPLHFSLFNDASVTLSRSSGHRAEFELSRVARDRLTRRDKFRTYINQRRNPCKTRGSDREADYEGIQPHQDDLMVISIVADDYKVERVLVDQGSSTNVLFWTTFQKLGKTEEELEARSGTLISFAGEQVRAIVSTLHLYMKYPVAGQVGTIRADQQTTRQCYKASLKIRSQREDPE